MNNGCQKIITAVFISLLLLFCSTTCTHSPQKRDVAQDVGAPARPTCSYIMRRQVLDSRTVKCEENKEWINYGKTVRNRPAVLMHPTTEEEVSKIVFIASRNNWKVRPVGSGHSWSQVTQTDDILLATDRLAPPIQLYKDKMIAVVGGGQKIISLVHALEDSGYALANLGDLQQQSVGGVVSTNTHGTGLSHSGFAGSVTHIRIVDGNGVVHVASPKLKKDLFYSALSGAGMVGVITQVGLKIVPNFNIYAETQPVPMDVLFDENNTWLRVARENEWFSFLWILYSDHATIFSGIKATSPTLKPHKDNNFIDTLNRNVFTPIYSSFYVNTRKITHRFIPPAYKIQRMLNPRTWEFKNGSDALSKDIDAAHWAWNLETEFFFPIQFLPEFINRMKIYMANLKAEGKVVPAPFLGFRFVKGDDSYLSPAYKYKGYNEFVALSVFDSTPNGFRGQFMVDIGYILQQIVVDRKLLRMHVGKIYLDHPHDFWSRFEHWKKFKRTRHQYDPKGTFLNQWTREFFDEYDSR